MNLQYSLSNTTSNKRYRIYSSSSSSSSNTYKYLWHNCYITGVSISTGVTHDITVVLDANGSVLITTANIDNGSSDDRSGIASMILNQNIIDCQTLGNVTLTQ
ncbi:hypothetical protein [Tenacibaculum soleae]|uniref:hypothetical protein n=1 Tax=Tenacibaculum soleae TaxID=447689 RepID=UPI0026E37857|nr:hypothetical protein [Tenacibaculum soleae]MDO6813272.1 hypothetical protein [Tenacibaculum soleae]